MSSPLIIALTKGRILKDTLPLLKAADIEPIDDVFSSRKLQFDTNRPDIKLIILRGSDVTTYVRFGVADLGVSGKDMLLEFHHEDDHCRDKGIYELLDLQIAKCKLMTAGIAGQAVDYSRRIRVATKFTQIAADFYAKKGIQADIIKLYGAMELAPLMDLADEIVDIVDTGNTLKANGLEPRDEIADVSSRLIANKASMKKKHAEIGAIVSAISTAVE